MDENLPLSKPPRGRPRGPSPKGEQTRARLFATAIELFGRTGYEATTLRAIAAEAGVSVGLLYRYFPSKRALVLALYERLTDAFVSRAGELPPGPWRERVSWAVRLSVSTLRPHRRCLLALVSTLVSAEGEGVLSDDTGFSRDRVAEVFLRAVVEADDAPAAVVAHPLGRLCYTGHLMIILWWLLDRSARQQATDALVARLDGVLQLASLSLSLPGGVEAVASMDALVRAALFAGPQ
jgi:AcrR family transcriptional regulator